MKNKGEKGGKLGSGQKIVRKNIAVFPPSSKLSPCVVTFFRELFAAPPEKEFLLGDAATTVPLSHTTCGGGGRIRRDDERIFLSYRLHFFSSDDLFSLSLSPSPEDIHDLQQKRKGRRRDGASFL